MSTALWILIGVVILAACSGAGKGKSVSRKGSYRIDRPHMIEPDDYECSVCHRRFRKDQMACPYCGSRFTGTEKDYEEFDEEADEWDAWDEEEGR